MTNSHDVDCCIVGGGPAGMMAGLLLARAGVRVHVLEKHADFLRDFRGDTLHPSTLEIMHELGLYDGVLALPHEKAYRLRGSFGRLEATFADFTHLPTRAKFVAMMPQWDFLNFLSLEARKYPEFQLTMQAEVTDLVREGGRVSGVEGRSPASPFRIAARLVLGCDGRHSIVRERAGLEVEDLGAPMDVLWFRMPRNSTDPVESMGRFGVSHLLVRINRGDYWQCGFVIAKGGNAVVRGRGIEWLRDEIVKLAPFLADRRQALASLDDAKLLTVSVDRLKRWDVPGLLCIGDAAHAMSPVGGVGINLAIQDAVATANLLAAPLREQRLTDADVARVQTRRETPTRRTQALQLTIQNRVIKVVLGSTTEPTPPFALRLIGWMPWLARIPARLMGMGFLPEHVETPDVHTVPTG